MQTALKKYKILKIEEPDFGCEGRMEGMPVLDAVLLLDQEGNQTQIKENETVLFQRNLNEGDEVIYHENRGLLKAQATDCTMSIRRAEEKDLEELLDIYNYEVKYGISTLDIHPRTLENRRVWMKEHNIENHPLIVAEMNQHVAGYASLSAYREKEAYRSTVELSVYIGIAYRRQGIATALMSEIMKLAKEEAATHKVVSVITSGNVASIKLHEKYEFQFCGTIHEVGVKFGKYRDIDNYELTV